MNWTQTSVVSTVAIRGQDQSAVASRDRASPLEPQRRQIMSEDFDAIGARLAELRKERDEAINTAGLE